MKTIKTKADRFIWVVIFLMGLFFLALQHYAEKQSDGLFWVIMVVVFLSFVQTLVLSLPDEPSVKYINENIEVGIVEPGQICDGYHTFDELYQHRRSLYIALCKKMTTYAKFEVWRSKFHSDGSAIEGWFLLGINKAPGEQITYHMPMSDWCLTNFAETLQKAPEFDGHTPEDVIYRIGKLN